MSISLAFAVCCAGNDESTVTQQGGERCALLGEFFTYRNCVQIQAVIWSGRDLVADYVHTIVKLVDAWS